MGDSPFAKEQLSDLIKERMKELEIIKEKCLDLENRIEASDDEVKHINALMEKASSFPEIYNDAPLPKKKMLLKMVIESIVVYKKGEKISIDIEINLYLQHILPMLNGMKSRIKLESA